MVAWQNQTWEGSAGTHHKGCSRIPKHTCGEEVCEIKANCSLIAKSCCFHASCTHLQIIPFWKCTCNQTLHPGPMLLAQSTDIMPDVYIYIWVHAPRSWASPHQVLITPCLPVCRFTSISTGEGKDFFVRVPWAPMRWQLHSNKKQSPNPFRKIDGWLFTPLLPSAVPKSQQERESCSFCIVEPSSA